MEFCHAIFSSVFPRSFSRENGFNSRCYYSWWWWHFSTIIYIDRISFRIQQFFFAAFWNVPVLVSHKSRYYYEYIRQTTNKMSFSVLIRLKLIWSENVRSPFHRLFSLLSPLSYSRWFYGFWIVWSYVKNMWKHVNILKLHSSTYQILSHFLLLNSTYPSLSPILSNDRSFSNKSIFVSNVLLIIWERL